jgi:hypothetical protein
MAGVKAKRGGPALATRWRGSSCTVCNLAIPALKDAWRVKSINLSSGKRHTTLVWQHRACHGK